MIVKGAYLEVQETHNWPCDRICKDPKSNVYKALGRLQLVCKLLGGGIVTTTAFCPSRRGRKHLISIQI